MFYSTSIKLFPNKVPQYTLLYVLPISKCWYHVYTKYISQAGLVIIFLPTIDLITTNQVSVVRNNTVWTLQDFPAPVRHSIIVWTLTLHCQVKMVTP